MKSTLKPGDRCRLIGGVQLGTVLSIRVPLFMGTSPDVVIIHWDNTDIDAEFHALITEVERVDD